MRPWHAPICPPAETKEDPKVASITTQPYSPQTGREKKTKDLNAGNTTPTKIYQPKKVQES
ncbi:hypothetical protein QJS04_geneDACA005153 [Acorus gramineus]|uniref:Uncharacterized protein n=1 Tax=Acorus gramineus TaxID=55184 RepID=A0AAV9AVG7_ACOGR|nr:hypothetical protein QJS04_geneDACA005153 [Acorus gramineus]